MAKAPAITAGHIRNLLRARYSDERQWCLAFEVRNSTGAIVGERYADAVAMNLWPSRGFAIHGFEIKATRADWMRELKKPEKADPVLAHCDYWWVVAPRKAVHLSELPAGWGFLAASPKRLMIAHDAARLTEEGAEDMYRGFVASLLRRHAADDPVFKEAVDNVREGYEEELKSALDAQEKRLLEECDRSEILRFKKEFEDAFGEQLWRPGKDEGRKAAERVRRAYALVRMLESPYGDLAGIRAKLQSLRDDIEALAEQLNPAADREAA